MKYVTIFFVCLVLNCYSMTFMLILKRHKVLFSLCMQINNEHSCKLDIAFHDCDSYIFVTLMCHLCEVKLL